MLVRTLVAAIFVGALALGGATLGADEMTLTGTVGDAMCGVKHMMDNAEGCTKGCVMKGSAYALIVDDTAYTLQTSSDQIKEELDGLAGIFDGHYRLMASPTGPNPFTVVGALAWRRAHNWAQSSTVK